MQMGKCQMYINPLHFTGIVFSKAYIQVKSYTDTDKRSLLAQMLPTTHKNSFIIIQEIKNFPL